MESVYFSPLEIHIRKGAKACPICGSTRGLYINTQDFYDKLVKENGGACLSMGCKLCNLELTQHITRMQSGDYSYKAMKKELLTRWNSRKSKNNKEEEQ